MNATRKIFLSITFLTLSSFALTAQNISGTQSTFDAARIHLAQAKTTSASEKTESEENSKSREELDPVTGFPKITEAPYAMFNYGITFMQINRIELQTTRSNYVREDYLLGAFWSLQTRNMMPVNSLLKISAYYPVYHTFNGMKQVPAQMFLYAADIFYAPIFERDMWKYVRLSFAPGLHTTYQLTDEYHMVYFGMALMLTSEFPLAKHWTLFADGMFTLDYPNFGTNRIVQPFDYAWQYHLDVGFRYSKRGENSFSYIDSRK